MKLDVLCNQVYVVALNEARIQKHEYILPEHFLYSALMFDVGKEMLEKSGGNVDNIKADLVHFFETKVTQIESENPIDSYGFVQMFEIAAAQAESSGISTVKLGNILAALFSLQESYAAYIMEKNGVTRLSLLRIISHHLSEESTEKREGLSRQKKEKELEYLRKYAVDLTKKAKANQLDPLIGREDIVERTLQVLSRRLKNNPIHVGDPGVGKTAVVEGLAQKIAQGKIPKNLKDSQIFYIDMGTVVAGTKYRGDFEERLIKILDIIAKEKKPIIYLDEIHTVVGAGAVSGGGMDATSILKPYLSRGDIRFIGSTTHEEYKKYFEKDRALSRRFQRIDIEEPSIEETILILTGLKSNYEEFHNVIYTDEVIRHICELTGKHLQERFMPDKAIDVMDEVGAMLRMHDNRSYKKVVTDKDIEQIVSKMAKIPENSVSTNEIEKLKNLESSIKNQVFGQDNAVKIVVDAIKASRSGLNDADKPVASLLFVGPTGVGKTEIAKQVADNLGVKLLRFDMSEYQEKHSVARLIGSPPGYVGYEEGGLLTEAIRKTPHTVLLLDEIEKAHPDIYNVLLQIMDYGSLTDNIGKKADFRNIILIMTSNAGAKEIGKKLIGFDDKTITKEAIDKEIERIFNPEFRNRLDHIVVFNHVNKQMARQITVKSIERLSKRLQNKNITLTATETAVAFIAEKGLSEKYGAREIIRVVEQDVKKQLIDEVLFGKLANGGSAIVECRNKKLTIKVKTAK